jgi:integrase
MPLRVTRRKSTGALTITGTIGTLAKQRIRRRAQSDDPALAEQEAAILEAEILRTEWHGERRGARSFAEALVSYLEAAPRAEHTKDYLRRIRAHLGDVPLSAIDQDAVTRAKLRMFGQPREIRRKDGTLRVISGRPPAPATVLRELVTPLRAVLRHAAGRRWCELPILAAPRSPGGRTRFLLPEEAERLLSFAAPHLQPLLLFLVGTGARISEAVELEWRDVDLVSARAILWPERTKNRRRLVLELPPRVVAALANLPNREGIVFRSPRGPYADRGRDYGGQIKSGWRGAASRAGIDRDLTPHDLRHTWASWHWALHRDLIALREAGGWSSVALVERYAHLLPGGQQEAIRAFLGHHAGTEAGETRKYA